MFVEDGEKRDYPSPTKAGLWKVKIGSPQYDAWRIWLQTEFGKRFFPEPVMLVWGVWPPTTQIGADSVAAALSELRDIVGGKSVPRHPCPWRGFAVVIENDQ